MKFENGVTTASGWRLFLQRDLLGYVDGMGLYSYVGGWSINRVDPKGMLFDSSNNLDDGPNSLVDFPDFMTDFAAQAWNGVSGIFGARCYSHRHDVVVLRVDSLTCCYFYVRFQYVLGF